jgi:hypothetical protein
MELFSPTLTRAYTIAKDKIMEINQALDFTIQCLAGSVWVTFDGDRRDVILCAGQDFKVDRDQRTLIQAMDAAGIVLIQPNEPVQGVTP